MKSSMIKLTVAAMGLVIIQGCASKSWDEYSHENECQPTDITKSENRIAHGSFSSQIGYSNPMQTINVQVVRSRLYDCKIGKIWGPLQGG